MTHSLLISQYVSVMVLSVNTLLSLGTQLIWLLTVLIQYVSIVIKMTVDVYGGMS